MSDQKNESAEKHGPNCHRPDSAFTLVAICSCCGEPNVIAKSFEYAELSGMKRYIEEEHKAFESKPSVQGMFKAFKGNTVKNGNDMAKMRASMRNVVSPERKDLHVLIGLEDALFEEVYKTAPKYWCHELHIL